MATLVVFALTLGTALVGSGTTKTALVAEGQRVFRFDTFGDEQLWTDTLRMHEVVEKSVDPTTALKVGLKVDADALPPGILAKVDLKSPATTVALLKMNAVVGLQATVDANNHITRLGITCALCHSTVDNSVMPRHRPPEGRLAEPGSGTSGAIIALSPAPPRTRRRSTRRGPGKYDPRYNQDERTRLSSRPRMAWPQSERDYTAEGPISYWNAYVAVTQMGGKGNFSDTRLGIDVKHSPDMVRSKLPALRAYQHSLPAPPPPAGSFDVAVAKRGRALFDRTCASCHVGGSGTDNDNGTLHAPAETGVDGAYAARTASKAYRTTPLRALWQHAPYFHDGSAATLVDVVAHYNRVRTLGFTAEQQRDLVEYLKSL
jgi:mono/diheme cytochrome c family protein